MRRRLDARHGFAAGACLVLLAASASCGKAFTAAPSSGGTAGVGAAAGAGEAGNPAGAPGASGSGATGGAADTGRAGEGGAGEGGSAGDGGDAEPAIPHEGLELWLRADRGLEPGLITLWHDDSGNERNAEQISSNYAPKLVADALFGMPAVVFDGDDDFLQLPRLAVDFSAGVSIFLVQQQESADTCQAYFEASNGSEIDDLHFGFSGGALLFEVQNLWLNDTKYQLPTAAPQITSGVLDQAALVHLRSNGRGMGEGMLQLPKVVERKQVFLGRSLYGGCAPLQGSMSELLLYSRALASDELRAVETYLEEKWGCCRE